MSCCGQGRGSSVPGCLSFYQSDNDVGEGCQPPFLGKDSSTLRGGSSCSLHKKLLATGVVFEIIKLDSLFPRSLGWAAAVL